MSTHSHLQAHCKYVKCGVPPCNNYFDGQRQEFIGISYFPFPSDPELRNQWLKAIDLPDDTDTSALKICSHHFGNNDIYSQETDGKTTAHLKPNAYPSRKLFEFIDIETSSSKTVNSNNLLTTDDDVLPIITSVSTLVLPNTTSLCGRSNITGEIKEIHHSEELISEETESIGEDDEALEPKNPVKGLQVVPALVKLPPLRRPRLPKLSLVGDSVSVNEASSVEPNAASLGDANSKIEDTTNKEPTTSTSVTFENPPKRRRQRASKEELRRREEEDEWEPSFWSLRAWKKAGLIGNYPPSVKKRKMNETKHSQFFHTEDTPTQSDGPEKVDDEGLEEEDDGWRVVEPIGTVDKEESEEESGVSCNPVSLLEVSIGDGTSGGNEEPRKRRPGPASKTCRPRYIPESCNQQNEDSSGGGEDFEKAEIEKKGDPEKAEQLDLSDDSLLMEWSFFKSLLPDLARLNMDERNEFKSFVLDTLNSAIYEGKSITPIMNM